jgi:hypothetical protein
MGTTLVITGSQIWNVWKPLTAKIEQAKYSMGEGNRVYFASPHYYLPSEIGHLEKDKFAGYTVIFRAYEQQNAAAATSDYTPWTSPKKLVGKDILFVAEKQSSDGFDTPSSFWVQKMKPYFDRVDKPIVFRTKKFSTKYREFYLIRAYGFKGPDSKMDNPGEARRYVERVK